MVRQIFFGDFCLIYADAAQNDVTSLRVICCMTLMGQKTAPILMFKSHWEANIGKQIMTESLMTIREMCEQFDVTARTLRFYETKGLLMPKRIRQKRLYSKRERARLKLILRGKRFGFSLEEIGTILDLYDKGDNQAKQITTAYEMARERLENLKNQRNTLDAAIAELEEQMRWAQKISAQISSTNYEMHS